MGTVKDIVRQIVVISSMAFAVIGSAFGSGAFSVEGFLTSGTYFVAAV